MNIYKFLTCVFAIILSVLLFFVLKVNFDESIPKYRESSVLLIDDISLHTNNASSSDLFTKFSFDKYLKNRRRINSKTLQKDIQILDSLYPDLQFQNKKLLSNAMTDVLYSQEKDIFNQYKPDEMIKLLQWVEQFKYYAIIDTKNYLLYMSIHDFWINKMANTLSTLSKNEASLKYDFKFRYLRARFSELGHDFGPKVTSIEKVVYLVIDSNWAHLFDASWSQASTLQKFLFFIILLLTFYAYFILLNKVLSTLKKITL